MHAQCHPPSGYRACSICLCVAITHLDFTHWQLRRALSKRRLLLQELRALAPPHPLLSVSSAAAAPLTDLPATQLLPPLPPLLLALCVRGRHHPAGQLMQLTSTDARLVSSSLIRSTTTASEMPLRSQPRASLRSTVISRFLFLGLTVSQWRCAHKKHVLGVTLATRERNRKSLPVLFGFFCVRPACQI